MRNARKKPSFLDTKIIPFLKKYGIFLIVLFLVFPYAYKYLKRAIESIKDTNLEAKKTENTNENAKADPIITKGKLEAIKKRYPTLNKKTMDGLSASAFKIAKAFGTNVDDNHVLFGGSIDLYNISAWGEDEKSAMSILKKHTGTFPILEELYYKTATKSKNLRNDILKYLSRSQYEEMSKFYKSKGYNWL
ncbi:hypothetical protein QWY99_10280 [Flavobacterium branchiarum]|uniref:Uncharacterized protein n=1 Tax=Flavobacterium branchiarum TaxID=1114870 RepID=A0ABV5FS21_9FLAO|nr:hypothetical protein [Flavobacterium branchiarum]MDN3673439.1 hypothetical protein [Flavobacterium branchiarum]